MTWYKVGKKEDVAKGASLTVTVEEEEIRVCRLEDGGFAAVSDRCSHDGGSFSDGTLDGTCLTCPRHGAQFDVLTGTPLRMPAAAPIEAFPVRVTKNGTIEVDVEDE
jgi:3-phenylpropionate/trans-cinnamate dioxygenase ferredoxin subunit